MAHVNVSRARQFAAAAIVAITAGSMSVGMLAISAPSAWAQSLGLSAAQTSALVQAVQSANGNSAAIQAAISAAVQSGVTSSPGGATADNAAAVTASVIAMFSGPAAPYPGVVSSADLGAGLASAGAQLGTAAAAGIASAVSSGGDTALASAYTASGGTLASNSNTNATGATPPGPTQTGNLPSLTNSLSNGQTANGLNTGGGSTTIVPSQTSL